jgi:hypothetical protein
LVTGLNVEFSRAEVAGKEIGPARGMFDPSTSSTTAFFAVSKGI